MKVSVLSFFAIITLVFVGCTSKDTTVIKGRFIGLEKSLITLEYVSIGNNTVVDSVITNKKGEFKFKIKIPTENPTFYNIRYKNQYIPLLLTKGEVVKLNSMGNISNNYEISGSPDSELLRQLNMGIMNDMSKMDSLRTEFNKEIPDSAKIDIVKAYSTIAVKIKRDYIRFVVTNSGSLASIYALYQKLPNGGKMFEESSDAVYYRMVSDSLKVRYPSSAHVVALMKDIEHMESAMMINNMLESNSLTVSNYPDIVLPDMYGNNIRLSLINQGKVVLLDFWKAQSPQSRMFNMELKELYEKYKDKGFEIYQVSLDESKPVWINTVQDQRLPWISVCDFRGESAGTARLYSVTKLPANYLISAGGDIIGKNIFGEKLEAKLASVLK